MVLGRRFAQSPIQQLPPSEIQEHDDGGKVGERPGKRGRHIIQGPGSGRVYSGLLSQTRMNNLPPRVYYT